MCFGRAVAGCASAAFIPSLHSLKSGVYICVCEGGRGVGIKAVRLQMRPDVPTQAVILVSELPYPSFIKAIFYHCMPRLCKF